MNCFDKFKSIGLPIKIDSEGYLWTRKKLLLLKRSATPWPGPPLLRQMNPDQSKRIRKKKNLAPDNYKIVGGRVDKNQTRPFYLTFMQVFQEFPAPRL